MARATGLEPATSGVTGRRSNQLNYARALLCKLPKRPDWYAVDPPSQAVSSGHRGLSPCPRRPNESHRDDVMEDRQVDRKRRAKWSAG